MWEEPSLDRFDKFVDGSAFLALDAAQSPFLLSHLLWSHLAHHLMLMIAFAPLLFVNSLLETWARLATAMLAPD